MFETLIDGIRRTLGETRGTPEIDRFALIIGAMKSGTTSLFKYLSEHPDIAPCSVDEPHFFAKSFKWDKGLDWYRDHWDSWDPERHRVALEASTNYAKGFKFEAVPRRIAEAADTGLDFRFIYIMRDPVERLVSQYNHGVRKGWNDPPDDPTDPHLVLQDDHLVDVSRYAAQLDLYMEYFDREDLHLLQLEALIDEPQRKLGEICEFLGIATDVEFTRAGRVYNKNDRPMIASPLWTKLIEHPVAHYLLKRTVSEAVRSRVRQWLGDTSVSHTYGISDHQRDRVLDELADDLRRLRDEYGVDISRWDVSG